MYIFDTLHKNPAKLHSEPDYSDSNLSSLLVQYLYIRLADFTYLTY